MNYQMIRTTGQTDTWMARNGATVAEIDSPRTPGAMHSWRVLVDGAQIAQGKAADLFTAREQADRWATA